MSTLLESRLSPQQRAQACAADAKEAAAEAAMRNLRAAQAERAVLATAAQAIDVSRRYCFDADYGSYTGHPMDPRSDDAHDENDGADDRLAASAPALLAALQNLMNGAWPYLTAAQQEAAMAAIEAATGEAL